MAKISIPVNNSDTWMHFATIVMLRGEDTHFLEAIL